MDPEAAAQRFRQLVSSATRVFIARGYRRATMADIARDMGVAPGTLYLYVESKEALFDVLIRRHLLEAGAGLPNDLPVRSPDLDQTLDSLKRWLNDLVDSQLLLEEPPPASPGETTEQLKAIVAHLYDVVHRYRLGFSLIERCSMDWPEMADIFYGVLRQGFLSRFQLFLQDRTSAGLLRPVPDLDVAARLVLESVAWFAMHRFGDPVPAKFPDDKARETVVDLLVASLAVSS